MKSWHEVQGAATGPRSSTCVVTIGMFDGVHRGHQHVLSRAHAAADGSPCVAVTFEPHPLAVTRPSSVPLRLLSLERRVELLHEHGADEVRVLAFGPQMAAWTPEEFIDRVLLDELRAEQVVVGENFRFGAKAAGDVDLLRARGATHGFGVDGVELVRDGEELSSSRVRRLVEQARLPEAASVLGRPHEVDGIVTPGDQRGRDLGFPTANVPVEDGVAVPPDGVYAGHLVTDGAVLPAAISVGSNPTFDGQERRVESYVMDHGHDLDLYGRRVQVRLVERLRTMAAFDSIDALVAQMHDDVSAARDALRT